MEVYPDPPLTIVKSEIVPPTPTVAVNAADTGSVEPVDTTKASKVLPLSISSLKKDALSTKFEPSLEETSPIILAVGYI